MAYNYSDDNWCVELPKMEREWDALVLMLERAGIVLYETQFDDSFKYLIPCHAQNCIQRTRENYGRSILSIFEAVAIITTPAKSANELKIEQLEKTIAEASAQIQELKVSLAK